MMCKLHTFLLCFSALYNSLVSRLVIYSNNVQIYCVKGKWHDRTKFSCIPNKLFIKIVITSICLPTQEVLEYLLEYASILFVQKLYLACSCKQYKTKLPVSSITQSNLYVFLLQIKLVPCLFLYPCCSSGWYRYLYKSFSDLCSFRISSLIVSFGFIPINPNC